MNNSLWCQVHIGGHLSYGKSERPSVRRTVRMSELLNIAKRPKSVTLWVTLCVSAYVTCIGAHIEELLERYQLIYECVRYCALISTIITQLRNSGTHLRSYNQCTTVAILFPAVLDTQSESILRGGKRRCFMYCSNELVRSVFFLISVLASGVPQEEQGSFKLTSEACRRPVAQVVRSLTIIKQAFFRYITHCTVVHRTSEK